MKTSEIIDTTNRARQALRAGHYSEVEKLLIGLDQSLKSSAILSKIRNQSGQRKRAVKKLLAKVL